MVIVLKLVGVDACSAWLLDCQRGLKAPCVHVEFQKDNVNERIAVTSCSWANPSDCCWCMWVNSLKKDTR